MSESTRAYIYRILLALTGVVGVYGLMSKEEVAAWLAVGAAALGNGLATVNTER